MTLLPVATAREASALTYELLMRRPVVLAACSAVFVVEGLAGLVPPWMLGQVVDVVEANGASSQLAVPVGWILAAAIAGGVAATASVALLAQVTEPALAELRERALNRAVHQERSVLETAGSGDLLSRVGDDVREIARSVTEIVPLLLNSVITVMFTTIGLFALDWRLGLAGLTATPFYVLGLRWYLPRSAPRYRLEREANGERAEALLTGVHGSRTLRAYGVAERHQQQVKASSWRAAEISLDVYRLLTRFFGRNNRAELIGLLLILLTGFWLVRADQVTVGAVTAAALLFHRLFNPVGVLLTIFDQVQSAGASLSRLAGLANLTSRDSDARPTPPADARLSVRNLHHEYVSGQPAVTGVTLEVSPRHRLAVVGASGAGKSTLGLAVAGQLRPTAGHLDVGGVHLADLADNGRPAVALVTQELHVFSGTVRANLTLARPEAGTEELVSALRQVGAWSAVEALPHGLDTVVGDGATTLPASLTQQLALARVLIADPLVVVLDEATAEAGSSGARDLERAAVAVSRGRTSLTIAHRLSQARDADNILVMENGRVVESGTHCDLVDQDGPYARLWNAWHA